MPDISQYAELIRAILIEGAKYFVLLLFIVLAVRFWKNATRVSAAGKQKAYVFAGVTTVLACGIGYTSFRNSMGKLNWHYGMQAFQSGNYDSAFSLFQTSTHYWRTADAIGGAGVCAMLSNQPQAGKQLLDEAKEMRKGQAVPFEEYHEGLYCFATGKFSDAIPLLVSSSRDSQYQWNVSKMLSVIALETNGTPIASELMKPFASVQVQDDDHAYIVARLDLAEGRTNEARALVEKFDTTNCSPLIKGRFDNVRAQLKD